MTMELGQEFSLAYAFRWDAPISAITQESITTVGSDEDRLCLANHCSVASASLDAQVLGTSAGSRVAVANHLGTSLETSLVFRAITRAIRTGTNAAINQLPTRGRIEVHAMIEASLQRLGARHFAAGRRVGAIRRSRAAKVFATHRGRGPSRLMSFESFL